MFDLPSWVAEFADLFRNKATRLLLVGGSVIDLIQDRPVKDWDIEAYGVSYSDLVGILTKEGLESKLVGQSFGLINTQFKGNDIDLSVPRKENRVGVGHKGFKVELISNLPVEEAFRRRDLTINAMGVDLFTGELVDPFGGMQDLREGRLVHVDPVTFVEDPLRAMRLVQLLPRKGKFVDPKTIELAKGMIPDMKSLPRDRFYEEFRKLLLKAERPSIGLTFMRVSEIVSLFPELEDLIGCPQNPTFHPEGDVWNHTLMVVDQARAVLDKIPPEWREGFMLGALLHDVGKPLVTNPISLRAYGHETEGVKVAMSFLERITRKKKVIDQVTKLVKNHMAPNSFVRTGAKDAAWRRLHNKCRLDVLAWMSWADSRGRGDHQDDEPKGWETALKKFAEMGEPPSPIPPVVLGRHLLARGIKPGKKMGDLIRMAYNIQIKTGWSSPEEILRRMGR